MKDITLNRSIPTQWSITISHLKIAVYQAVLYDANDVVLKTWQHQRTDDSIPDIFDFDQDFNLNLAHLWFQAVVMDPADQGGPYIATVSLIQNGQPVDSYTYAGQVPNGAGKFDAFVDEVRLLYK